MNFRMVIPIQIALIALVVGAYFAYVALIGPSDNDEPVSSQTLGAAMDTIEPRAFSAKGGFAIGVPEGITSKNEGKTITLRTSDRTLVVVAGPIQGGGLKVSSKEFVRSLKQNYTDVRVLGTKKQRVDDRDALATYGRARNAENVRIRFVSVVVKAQPRNFVINAFTAFDTDPATVLPKVDAIVRGFSVLK